MCKIEGKKVFECIYTALNEFGQIRMQSFLYSVSHDELRMSLEDTGRNCELLGSPIRVVYTDTCCADAALYKSTCLNPVNRSISKAVQLDPFPLDVSPVVVNSRSDAAAICNGLCEMADRYTPDNPFCVGFDCEWDFDCTTKVSGKVATMQIAIQTGQTWVLQLLQIGMNPAPNELVTFLDAPNILKVGKQIGGDKRRLLDNWNLLLSPCVELGKLARQKGFVNSGSASLEALVQSVLKHSLNKGLRISHWSTSHLSTDQVMYAAKDALASLQVYHVSLFKIRIASDL